MTYKELTELTEKLKAIGFDPEKEELVVCIGRGGAEHPVTSWELAGTGPDTRLILRTTAPPRKPKAGGKE